MAVKKSTTTRKPATARRTATKAAAKTTTKTTVKSATRKTTPATAAKAVADTAVAAPTIPAVTPEPTVVSETRPELVAPVMRKKQLVEAVVARSGMKRKDVKPVVEAMLAVLGESIAEGRELNVQPLGKLKVNRTKNLANGQVMMLRVRQPLARPGPVGGSADPDLSELSDGGLDEPKDPLAEAAE